MTLITYCLYADMPLAMRGTEDIRVADSFGRFRQSVTAYSSLLTRILLTLHVTARADYSSVTRRHTGTSSKTFNNNTKKNKNINYPFIHSPYSHYKHDLLNKMTTVTAMMLLLLMKMMMMMMKS